jgi:RNA polymerase sigma-70 factor (ECF subfamily)
MTQEDYGKAYEQGYSHSVRFLVSRGLDYDTAQETSQEAWVKGWEKISQLRDREMLLPWIKSIALNIHRTLTRREPVLQTLPELSSPPDQNLLRIDVRRILKSCKRTDRVLLDRFYLQGFSIKEIARRQGVNPVSVRTRLFRARHAASGTIQRKAS